MRREFNIPAAGLIVMMAIGLSACSGGTSSGFGGILGGGSKDQVEVGPDGRDAKGRRVYDANKLRADAICPRIQIRSGTNIYKIHQRGVDEETPKNLRYQATISQAARECTLAGESLAIKVGIAGRLLTGPLGSGDTVNLPIRVVVLDSESEPVYSMLHTLPVAVIPPASSQAFTKIDNAIVIPKPTSAATYKVFVGFDADT